MALLLPSGDAFLLPDGGGLLFPGEGANTAPVITVQPADRAVFERSTVTFSVIATDAESDPLTYQWYDASDDSMISGATSSSYSFTATLTKNGMQFYCRVSDGTDTVQSDTATLTVSRRRESVVLDVRVMAPDGSWASLIGPAGVDGDTVDDLIRDDRTRTDLTWSSSKISGLLAGIQAQVDAIKLLVDEINVPLLTGSWRDNARWDDTVAWNDGGM